jgi:hypothetical protein
MKVMNLKNTSRVGLLAMMALVASMGEIIWHVEGGKGVKPKLVKFQLRPDPLAK